MKMKVLGNGSMIKVHVLIKLIIGLTNIGNLLTVSWNSVPRWNYKRSRLFLQSILLSRRSILNNRTPIAIYMGIRKEYACMAKSWKSVNTFYRILSRGSCITFNWPGKGFWLFRLNQTPCKLLASYLLKERHHRVKIDAVRSDWKSLRKGTSQYRDLLLRTMLAWMTWYLF